MDRPPRAARPLAVALIGQRFMGRAHSNAWGQVGRFFDPPRPVVLHTVAGRQAASLPEFARRWGWQHWTARWRDIARDPEIALVDLATPNHLRAEQGAAMLEAGKHVACEKPLAGTLADAREMSDAGRAAGRHGVRSFVWFHYRRCPAVGLAWQLVREGRLGEIRHVRARYLQSWGGPDTPLSWRFRRALAGSGAHGDLNAHMVDLARFLTGDEIAVVHGATARTFVTERRIDESATLSAGSGRKRVRSARGAAGGARRAASNVDDCLLFLAGFRSGAVASFEASRAATGHLNDHGIEISGTRGALRFDLQDMNVLQLFEHGPARGAAGAGRVPDSARRTAGWRTITCTAPEHPWAAAWWPEAHGLGYEHGFVNMAADILGALDGRRPPVPLPDFADAYQTQRVLEAALLAARNRCAVKLSEVR